MCGSFCTFKAVFPVIENLAENYNVIPILSDSSCSIDSRFGKAESYILRLSEICGHDPLCTIAAVEPIGPKKLLDALIIAPCTGNTLAKLSHGIADTPVTMAVKSHLRNGRPVVIAVSTNDALGGAAENIGKLMARKHYYFVPFRQDDPLNKPTSMVADFSRIHEALDAALEGRQLQPVLL
jgi:dipicolinate synthase subunit B